MPWFPSTFRIRRTRMTAGSSNRGARPKCSFFRPGGARVERRVAYGRRPGSWRQKLIPIFGGDFHDYRPKPRALERAFKGDSAPDLVAEHLPAPTRSEEHTSELQSQSNLVCRLLLEKKKKTTIIKTND